MRDNREGGKEMKGNFARNGYVIVRAEIALTAPCIQLRSLWLPRPAETRAQQAGAAASVSRPAANVSGFLPGEKIPHQDWQRIHKGGKHAHVDSK